MSLRIRLAACSLTPALLLTLATPSLAAVRHHSYVGTVTRLAATSLTIHSKTHSADYSFVIDGSTRFLQHGQAIARTRFHVGSYVTVSFSSGPHSTMIAYHISLRR